ncbi:hypothetical protein [Micromonospora tulbaghiae]|uniref:hypothetical protein n=1 Tax=Micromonospora tulbaghiae TaxID=479978 RepID=UPI0033E481C0
MASRTTFGGSSGGAQPQIPADRGYLAWTQPPYALSAGSVPTTAGTLYLRRLRRVPAGQATSIITHVVTAGTTLTTGQCFAALFTAAGALVAQTADQSTAWASTGLKTMTLAGGPYPLTAGDYYVGIWFNGTTGPSIIRSASISTVLTNAGLTAGNYEAASANTGLTTTAPASVGTQTAQVFEWWFALA